MKTRISVLIVLLLVLPTSMQALETNELIAVAAMPLAVAAVSDIADVPAEDLVTVVSALNRAHVPAPQFIEVVRYVPVALVERRDPAFVTYVTTQAGNGLVGNALALSIADRLGTTYGIREINVAQPPAVYLVEERQLIPTVVTTRLQPVSYDPLALVAMPLAVAAVANLTDVPAGDLVSFISALNQASVPPTQFVEVVRYSAVMLADPTVEPQFVQFVTMEADRGIAGSALAFAVADRIRSAGITEIDVVRPLPVTIVDRDEFLPTVVRTRVATVKTHPHGGPPGQLKKDRGLQTGAEVVHGTHPGRAVISRERDSDRRPRVIVPDRDRERDRGRDRDDGRVTRQKAPRQERPRVTKPERVDRDRGQPRARGESPGKPRMDDRGKSNHGNRGGASNKGGSGGGGGKGKGKKG